MGGDPAPPSQTLRISSSVGLAAVTCDVPGTLSAHLRDLVWIPASTYLGAREDSPGEIDFSVKEGVAVSPEELARALGGPGIIDAHVANGHVVARLAPNAPPPPPAHTCLDLGPFKQASFSPERILLTRRSGQGIESIEIRDVGSSEEEWRRFLAREVDLVPNVRESLVKNLADVPSVRLVPIESSPETGLVFRVDRPPFSDLRLRQMVSLGVRRRAIARAIVGNEAAASTVAEDRSEAGAIVALVGGTPAIQIAFASTMSEEHRAAMVLEQQLLEIGLRVALKPVSVDVAGDMLGEGKFEIFLMSAGFTPSFYYRVQTGSLGNVTGYSNPELDAAIARGDQAKALEILNHDLPMTPLYFQRSMVAIDRKFCNVHPRSSGDLSWLAEVHLCAQGETE